MINQLRLAIIQRLQPLANQVRIIGDDTDGEVNIKSDYGIRVGYAGGQFNQPNTTETVPLQTGSKSFEVSLEIKDLRNETKTVELLESVENLLIGFCPCVEGSTGEFYLQSDRFVKSQNGIYYYVITIGISCFLLKE